MASSSPLVTILVPTYNRAKELKRLLTFLDRENNPFPVLVLDGSIASIQEVNLKTAKAFPNITVRTYPEDLHLGLRKLDGLKQIKTPYVVLCGDDDFVIPSAVAKCVDFLEKNSDYSQALGRMLSISYSRKPFLRRGLSFKDDLSLPINLFDSNPVSRFFKLELLITLGGAPIYYAVRRTDQAREIFSHSTPTLKYTSLELLSNSLSLIFGKVKSLPILYGFRDYSSETIRQPIREDVGSYFTEEDLAYIRPIYRDLFQKKTGATECEANFAANSVVAMHSYFVPEPAPVRLMPLKRLLTRLSSILIPRLVQRLHKLDVGVIKSAVYAQSQSHK